MRAAADLLGAEGGAAVGRSLTALTALQTLNLSGKALCSERLCGLCFLVREWVVTRQGLRLGPFVSLMRVAGNSLGAEGFAAVGRSLTALTALQTLDLSGKALCFLVLLYCVGLCFVVREWVVTSQGLRLGPFAPLMSIRREFFWWSNIMLLGCLLCLSPSPSFVSFA
jgi:hypothetical protein